MSFIIEWDEWDERNIIVKKNFVIIHNLELNIKNEFIFHLNKKKYV